MTKGRCYLFLGPELGEKQDAIEEIRRNLRGDGGSGGVPGNSPEENSFYAGETGVSGMVSILRNGSLFSEKRLFFIKNAEVLKKKEELDLLAAYLESPQTDTTLILISDAVGIDKRLEKIIPPEQKRIFYEYFEDRKTEWVSSFFRRRGYTIDEDGIETILELVENNTDALKRECSRLMFFLGKDRRVTGAEVEKWLSHTREESAFTLFSRIAAGDLPRSLETLHSLLDAREPPQAIFAGLAWCFRKLRDYLTLVNSGRTGEFELRKIGLVHPKARNDYTLAARQFPQAGPCLSLIAEFDILIRGSGASWEGILMDVFLYKLIAGSSSPRAGGKPRTQAPVR
jgi:DNA polymerase-3 subunit delta